MIVTNTSLRITGLEPNTPYRIRVRAKAYDNSEYTDCTTWSNGNDRTNSLVKLQPPRNIVLIDMTPTTLKFSYDPPANTSGMTGYYFYVNGTYVASATMSQTRTVEFTNLTPDVTYTLGFQSVGDQIYADNSDIANVAQTPLSEKLIVTSNNFPTSDSWPSTGFTYGVLPKKDLTTIPSNVFTTLFTG